ncbi:SF1B family DNA helicase RecD2 [[Acholeplasma] multilocale]|uniref:SF1B family DNA helicase RecD2 n=1 Tax=[Acholeplasma] multilocale TaxID=264638 RepID=UPI00047E2233|nr:AAA family ATPase [[Acholeplasma] multilocale]
MEDKKVLRGHVSKILYANDNGWGLAIFSSEENAKAQIKINGNIGLMKQKVLYEINGVFETHPKYGKSFIVDSYKVAEANSKEQTVKYLSSPLFPTVGKVTAELIVNHYGDEAMKKIKDDIDSLFDIPGLDPKYAHIIKTQMRMIEEDEKLTSIFFENNLKLDILNQMRKYTESDAEIESIFKNDFFRFAIRRKMKPFEEIDKIALYFGLQQVDPERIGYWAWKLTGDVLMQSGDTYTNLGTLINKISKTLNINDKEILMDGILYAKEKELLVLTEKRIYTYESFTDEQIIARKLHDLNTHIIKHDDGTINRAIKEVESDIRVESRNPDFSYDEEQKLALRTFANSRLMILTGGPGTGKTTVIKGMVKLFRKLENSVDVAIAAPTGRAASRIRESSWELAATTLHKLLKANANDDFEISEKNPLTNDLIIIDECSMIENRLFSQFIQSVGDAKKVILVGDANQLPSVGFGNMFEDIISVKRFPTIKLKSIHRQAGGNGIIDLAYAIQEETVEYLDFDNLENLTINFADNKNSLEFIKNVYQDHKETMLDNPLSLQIISPVYAGELGIENLNSYIQAEFNENIMSPNLVYDRGRFRYTVEDKVMFLKNDSDMNLSNGDVGIIKSLKMKNNKLEEAWVDFQTNNAFLESNNFNDVALAYACSVHKTQGSEYQNVILAIEPGRSSFFLNKKLLYTAVTRAKDHLYIVGDKELFLKAIKREPITRKTTLKEVIEKY